MTIFPVIKNIFHQYLDNIITREQVDSWLEIAFVQIYVK